MVPAHPVLPRAGRVAGVRHRDMGDCAVTDATGVSRYYSFTQHDGRGHGILRLDAIGSNRATVIDVDLTEDEANARLAAYRREE